MAPWKTLIVLYRLFSEPPGLQRQVTNWCSCVLLSCRLSFSTKAFTGSEVRKSCVVVVGRDSYRERPLKLMIGRTPRSYPRNPWRRIPDGAWNSTNLLITVPQRNAQRSKQALTDCLNFRPPLKNAHRAQARPEFGRVFRWIPDLLLCPFGCRWANVPRMSPVFGIFMSFRVSIWQRASLRVGGGKEIRGKNKHLK